MWQHNASKHQPKVNLLKESIQLTKLGGMLLLKASRYILQALLHITIKSQPLLLVFLPEMQAETLITQTLHDVKEASQSMILKQVIQLSMVLVGPV